MEDNKMCDSNTTSELDLNASSTSGNETGEVAPVYYYNSCSIARKIKKASTESAKKKTSAGAKNEELTVYMDGKKVNVPKKFEVCVIYNSSKSKKIRVRKVKFGYYGDVERESCESEQFQQQRKRYEKLLIDSSNFDKETFVKTGGFFNPKFWDINVQWLQQTESSQEGYIKQIDEFLQRNFSN